MKNGIIHTIENFVGRGSMNDQQATHYMHCHSYLMQENPQKCYLGSRTDGITFPYLCSADF